MKIYQPPQFACMNCEKPIPWERQVKLFCSETCVQDAAFVRYVRACTRDRRIRFPDIQLAISIRRAHVLAGGYPTAARRLSPSIRAAVIKRDKGRCCHCGKRGSDIDHIDGSSSAMSNLQLLCQDCHFDKTTLNMVPLTPAHPRYARIIAKGITLDRRIKVKRPKRVCDNDRDWRAISKRILIERKEEFHSSVVSFSRKDVPWTGARDQISDRLNELGIPTWVPRFKWSRNSVKKVLDFAWRSGILTIPLEQAAATRKFYAELRDRYLIAAAAQRYR